MSSTSCAWVWALRSMTSTPRAHGAPRRRCPPRRMCAQPRIALSGVRSSCETVARNSSFMRLALSASARATCSRASDCFRSSSSCCSRWWSRAFSIESAAIRACRSIRRSSRSAGRRGIGKSSGQDPDDVAVAACRAACCGTTGSRRAPPSPGRPRRPDRRPRPRPPPGAARGRRYRRPRRPAGRARTSSRKLWSKPACDRQGEAGPLRPQRDSRPRSVPGTAMAASSTSRRTDATSRLPVRRTVMSCSRRRSSTCTSSSSFTHPERRSRPRCRLLHLRLERGGLLLERDDRPRRAASSRGVTRKALRRDHARMPRADLHDRGGERAVAEAG